MEWGRRLHHMIILAKKCKKSIVAPDVLQLAAAAPNIWQISMEYVLNNYYNTKLTTTWKFVENCSLERW